MSSRVRTFVIRDTRGWRDGTTAKVIVVRAWGPEFRSPALGVVAYVCDLSTQKVETGRSLWLRG